MNEELEDEFYFLRNFVIDELENCKIENIIIHGNSEDNSVVFVLLKVYEVNWQKYFLDAGAGFWYDTETKDYQMIDCIEEHDYYFTTDYTEKFNIKNNIIRKAFCEPNDKNSRIILELENGERIVLRCKNSKIFDDDCEILIE